MKERPGRGASDVAHTAARVGLAAVPVVGGSAAEIFSAIVTPPISKRRDEWIESVVERLKALEDQLQEFKVEDLSENEMFITTMMHASQASIRNHQEEKLEALRNAVLNAALPKAPDEDLQMMFLNLIDSFTPWHLRVLKFFENPRKWGEDHGVSYPDYYMASPASALEEAFKELHGRRDFYDLIVTDLFSRGLMNTDSLHTAMNEQGIFASRTTALGKDFIRFIADPS